MPPSGPSGSCSGAPELPDLDRLAALHGDPETHRLTRIVPRTRAETETLLAGWLLHWQARGFGYWVAERRADGVVVGAGGLEAMRLHGIEVLNLYYRFEPSTWGTGLALELCAAAIACAREAFPGRGVVSRVDPDNGPARRLAERAGLVRRPETSTTATTCSPRPGSRAGAAAGSRRRRGRPRPASRAEQRRRPRGVARDGVVERGAHGPGQVVGDEARVERPGERERRVGPGRGGVTSAQPSASASSWATP